MATPMKAADGIRGQRTAGPTEGKGMRSSARAGLRVQAAAERNDASPFSARMGAIGQESPFAALTRVIALPRLRHNLHSDSRLRARITTIRILVRIFVQSLTPRQAEKNVAERAPMGNVESALRRH